jgi:hypothetical protein
MLSLPAEGRFGSLVFAGIFADKGGLAFHFYFETNQS